MSRILLHIFSCTLVAFVAFGLLGLSEQTLNGFDLSIHSVPLNEIFAGGPPRDGIPALMNPHFVEAQDATYLKDHDRILGLASKKGAKAYPINILNWHEIVNDVFDERPIVITYCPLCGTGIGFLGTIRGRPATFGVSGLLYQSDLLMYDHQTESLWSQMAMESVGGPLTGEKLDVIFLEHTTWNEWKKIHPQSLVMSISTGYSRAYDRDPYAGYVNRTDLMFPTSHVDPRYHTKEFVLGLEVKGVFKAYPFSELGKGPKVLSDTINGLPVLIHFNPAGPSAKALAFDGTPLPSLMAYWFAWSAFHPDTLLYSLE